MKQIAVVYMAHDGFTSLYTGVGTVARDFLLSFPQVRTNLSHLFPDISLHLFATTIKYNSRCLGYSEAYKDLTQRFMAQHRDIHLVELLNSSSGDQSYGTIGHWQAASISGATFISLLAQRYERVIAITVDTPFAQVATRYFNQHDSLNVDIIWLPQSTSKIHDYGDCLLTLEKGLDDADERYPWEKRAIAFANSHPKVKIAYVGKFMREHLITSYGASPSALISVTNALNFERLRGNIVSQQPISLLLQNMGIPVDRPLLFSFGRAEPYKGLDLVLRNSINLIQQRNYFVLILCSPNRRHHPYVAELQAMAKDFEGDIKVVFDLDFVTPHYVMQWHNTRILAILSRSEPFGLIPIEARFYKNENMLLLVSNIGGLLEQVEHGVDGFVTALDDASIRAQLDKLSRIGPEERRVIAEIGFGRVIADYDQVKINTQLLRSLLSFS